MEIEALGCNLVTNGPWVPRGCGPYVSQAHFEFENMRIDLMVFEKPLKYQVTEGSLDLVIHFLLLP